MSLDTELTHMKNIKSKETTDLTVNSKTLKLEDNVGGNLDDLGNKDDYLDTTLKTWSMKEIFDKLDFIEIKHFSLWKMLLREWQSKHINWEKIFAKDMCNRLSAKI